MAGKRKRAAANKLSPEDQYNVERNDRYRTLLKFCEKQIRKEGKAVKTFEAQKIVKRLKLLRGGDGNGGAGSGSGTDADDANASGVNDKIKKAQEKRRRQAERLEKKLQLTKAYDVDRLVALCSKRIGLGNLAPPPSDDVEEGQIGDNAEVKGLSDEEKVAKKEFSEEDEEMLTQLTEDMLKHKRLVDVVEKLNDRITDHRRWVLRREDHLFGGGFPGQDDGIPAGGGKKRKGKKGSGKADNDARADHAGPAALFIGSLSGAGMDEGDGEEGEGYGDYYGPGGHEDDYGLPIKKKNRPGQRQRKAKAMAIEAKKAGKTWDSSTNWREKKKSNDDDDGGANRRGNKSNAGDHGSRQRASNEQKVFASGLKTGDKVAASDVATMGKDWKEAGKAHPSWAAQQAQKAKSGIQQFAGKKITFD